MEDSADVSTPPAWPNRGRFWRRLAAFAIDYLIVFIPLYLVVTALFAYTNGDVQATNLGLRFSSCYEATLNEGSDPRLNGYKLEACTASIFGLTAARWVVATKPIAKNKEESITFFTDAEGHFGVVPLDLSFAWWLPLFVYLLLMERSGASLGKRAHALKVHDESDFARTGIPMQKSLLRQTIKFLPFILISLIEGGISLEAWGTPLQEILPAANGPVQTTSDVVGFAALVLLAILALAWLVWIAVSIIMGDDAIHDRVAGTSVRRKQP